MSDGVLYHVLSKLMVLDGERLSYRTLAVEQIGSVYETIMGFDLHVAAVRSIAIKPAKKHGAPATVIYLPNRSSNLCSFKHCPFASVCEDEFGGRVRGGEEDLV